jgi:hypothetical protein
MKKQVSIFIPLLSIAVVFAIGYESFGWKDQFKEKEGVSIVTPDSPLSSPILISPQTPQNGPETPDSIEVVTWKVFQNYLEFAKNHDLEGVKSLSYQMSATCLDPAKEKECFALMDSVYNIASGFKSEEFPNIEYDERQIIMFSDVEDQMQAVLYFTRTEDGTPKILGLRFCAVEESTPNKCVETDPQLRDRDNNGWWDSVESLFYKSAQ